MVAPIASVVAAPIAPLPPVGGGMTAGMMQVAQAAQMASGAAGQTAPLASFQEFFADAVKHTNSLDMESADKQRQLLVGETDNIHEVMIAMEKASLSLNLTLAVRNKVIDAYTEIMRMQI